MDYRSESVKVFRQMQAAVCAALEAFEPQTKFIEDQWQRPDLQGAEGGGGATRVLQNGLVIEKGGVNFSQVSGTLPAPMVEKMLGVREERPFFASGVSLVIHPKSPMVPTVHANIRYLEVGEQRWFGGGADLTPYYLFDEDAIHFHRLMKRACDAVGPEYYSACKKKCDEYFYLPHREEARGIGGIFFDYFGKEDPRQLATGFALAKALAENFVEAYAPIVKRRKDLSFTPAQKEFQLLRRGRYVEFNLVYDRGTQFGLMTKGRAESVLMSLPAEVKWNYNSVVADGTAEARLIEVLKRPRNWIEGEL